MAKFIIYTDGGSRGNPGPAGAGALVYDANGKTLKEVSHYIGEKTNNFAEYEGVIIGLQALKKLVPEKERKDTEVEVRLDSELVQRQLSGIYQIKIENLFGQYIKVHNIRVRDFPNIAFVHVPREKNAHADRLANAAMDSGSS